MHKIKVNPTATLAIKLVFLLLMASVMIGLTSCYTEPEPVPARPKYYYSVQNIDIDGQYGDPAIAKRARTYNDPLGPGATTVMFETSTLRFETFVCYDGAVGAKTIDAAGARFGLRITRLSLNDHNPTFMFTENTVKNAGTNDVQTPLSMFQPNTNIGINEFNQYAEPSTGIVWGFAHFESIPANITWELKVVGNKERHDTKANFSSGSEISGDDVCSSFALPIEWVVKPHEILVGDRMYLYWVVNEVNVDYYEIRKSRTGMEEIENWELCLEVPSSTPSGLDGTNVKYMVLIP